MKLKIFIQFLALSSLCLSLSSFANDNIKSFSKAKSELTKIYHKLNDSDVETKTIYCNYPIITKLDAKKKLFVDSLKEGYKVRKDKNRATRIEFEHVMPAHYFGHQLKCWQDGGRKKCAKNSERFRIMESDLHNLYPAVGEVNNDRGNMRFTEGLLDKKKNYGSCKINIDFKNKQVIVDDNAKGKIARSYLYMAQKYDLTLNDRDRKMFKIWNDKYAPDEYECARNELIKKVQGNYNKFTKEKCPNLL